MSIKCGVDYNAFLCKNQTFYCANSKLGLILIIKLHRLFTDWFKSELDRRKSLYYSQKTKKDQAFQGLEHDKTQLRIVEIRHEKTNKNNQKGFPLKLNVSLINGLIDHNYIQGVRSNNPHIRLIDDVGIIYTVSNGVKVRTSQPCDNLASPSFNDEFSMTLKVADSNLEFKIYLENSVDKSKIEIDQFYIEGSTLQH